MAKLSGCSHISVGSLLHVILLSLKFIKCSTLMLCSFISIIQFMTICSVMSLFLFVCISRRCVSALNDYQEQWRILWCYCVDIVIMGLYVLCTAFIHLCVSLCFFTVLLFILACSMLLHLYFITV
jgi:hypothetical protein